MALAYVFGALGIFALAGYAWVIYDNHKQSMMRP